MSYPKITDDDFNEKITKKFKRYAIPKKKKSFEEICYPKGFTLQGQQEFVAKYINPNTPYKGLLLFHQIGSGKTCSAITIAESWRGIRKIIFVGPASLLGNFRDELRSLCAGNNYLKQSERTKLSKLHPSSEEYKEIIEKSDSRIDKYYNIYSYNKFIELAEEKAISLHNSILIIDEVQNVVSEHGKYYQILNQTIQEAPESLRVVLLSATPIFNSVLEIGLTLNLLRIPFQFPEGKDFDKMFISTRIDKNTGRIIQKAKNLDKFKEMIKGYVSYYRGAPQIAFPEFKIKYIKCEMSEFQYRSYLTVLEKEEKEYGISRIHAFRTSDIKNLPNSFLLGSRLISNVAFPNKSIGDVGFESFKGKYLDSDNLGTYSSKFHKMMTTINNSSGPLFFYSNFVEYNGLKSFIKVLEHYGYLPYNVYGEGKKRYAVWTGEEKSSIREEIKAVFNQPSNINGSKIKILLGSPSIREGVSLANVRKVMICEPYWNWARMNQVIGRAIRFCSHKRLPEEKRNVKVYIYIATHENEEETVDQYIMRLAERKDKLISEFESAMKDSAVDCKLFINANIMAGDDNIVCDKN